MIDSVLIKSIKACENMNDRQIAAIQKHCVEVNFKKDDKLFTEGDAAEYMWNVIDGQVDLRFEMPDPKQTSSAQTVSSVEVGELDEEAKVLGWSCFVPPFKMRLSAYCVSARCKIVKIKKDDLLTLFNEDVEMGYKFLTYLVTVVGYRFHQFQDHVARNMGEDLMSGW